MKTRRKHRWRGGTHSPRSQTSRHERIEIVAASRKAETTIATEVHSRLRGDGRVQMDVEVDQLVREFGAIVSPSDIAEAIDRALADVMPSARLTQFVPLLAYRYARDRLRDEVALHHAV